MEQANGVVTAPAGAMARTARVLHIASLVILGIVTVLAVMPSGGTPPDPLWGILTIVVVGGYTTIGRLIVTRTGNVIGWVFLGMGLAAAVGLPAEGYLQVSYEQPYVASLPGTAVAGWAANLFPVLIALALPMLFLLFPTGAPPTPRWRWVSRLWLVGAALSFVWAAFRPGNIYGEPGRFRVENPFGLEVLGRLDPVFPTVGVACVVVSALAAVASLVVRFRRARGDERLQIRWLMLVGIAAVTFLLLMVALEAILGQPAAGDNGVDDLLWIPSVLTFILGPPAATTIAVFKYRLYDIDVVISKTIVFAGLALFITSAYVAIVVGVGTWVGEENLALRIAATATVALLFQPARLGLRRSANRLVYGQRATPYEVLARFSDRVGGAYAADDVLPRTARVIAEGVHAERVGVWLHIGDELVRSAAWPPDPETPAAPLEGDDLPPLAADRTVGVRHQGELLGAITITKARNESLSPQEVTLVDRLAEQSALVLANVRLTADLEAKLVTIRRQAAELQASRQRIVAAQDEERRRLERDIHDGAQQHLVALAVQLRLARATLATDPTRALAMVTDLRAHVDDALDTLRELALGVYPPLLEEQGIVAALAARYTRSELPVHVEADGLGRHPIEIEAAVYFCVLEALQNAAKYARAERIDVLLSEREGTITFEVRDDGMGFDLEASGGGTGLDGMHDRLAVIGGEAQITSEPGRGTSVRGRVPVGIGVAV